VLDDPSSNPGKDRTFFFSPKMSRSNLRSVQPQRVPRFLFPGAQRLRHDDDHALRSSGRLRMSGVRLLLLCAFTGYIGAIVHPKCTMWAENHLKMKKHKELLFNSFKLYFK
jgi:hypothetical protein